VTFYQKASIFGDEYHPQDRGEQTSSPRLFQFRRSGRAASLYIVAARAVLDFRPWPLPGGIPEDHKQRGNRGGAKFENREGG